jgi:hypothetical protein
MAVDVGKLGHVVAGGIDFLDPGVVQRNRYLPSDRIPALLATGMAITLDNVSFAPNKYAGHKVYGFLIAEKFLLNATKNPDRHHIC